MKRLFFALMALVLVACDVEFEIGGTTVTLSDITIECIKETPTSNNTSNHEFDTHTYLCSGNIGGYRGDCYIRVMHDNFIVHNDHHLTLSGETMPFEFTFAPEWGYLDKENLNFIIEVLNNEGNTICKTTVVARHN